MTENIGRIFSNFISQNNSENIYIFDTPPSFFEMIESRDKNKQEQYEKKYILTQKDLQNSLVSFLTFIS